MVFPYLLLKDYTDNVISIYQKRGLCRKNQGRIAVAHAVERAARPGLKRGLAGMNIL